MSDTNAEKINENYAVIEKLINRFSDLIASFCPSEAPDLTDMLDLLELLVTESDNCHADMLSTVAGSCKAYVKNMTNKKITNTQPLEEGLSL